MGCGASCTDTTASNKQPSLLGVACLATLLTKLHSASPLLTDKCWQKFAAQAGLDSSRYQLRIGDTLSLG